MCDKYSFPSDGMSKPKTFANEHKFARDVLERVSVLYMIDKDDFPLSKDDWENIIRAGEIIGTETASYGPGYIIDSDSDGNPKVWAHRLGMKQLEVELEKNQHESFNRTYLIQKLNEVVKTGLLADDEECKLNEILSLVLARNPEKKIPVSQDLVEVFKKLFEDRPKNADLNMEWQKSVLIVAKEKDTPMAWVYAAEVIAATNPDTYYKRRRSFLFKR